jgi:PKD repeat protein
MVQTNVISVNAVPTVPLIANFTASPVNGTAPLTVTFQDESFGNPTRITYTFGDGISATGANQIHTYRYPGVYTVNQTITRYEPGSGTIVSNVSVQKGLITVREYTPVGIIPPHGTPVS